MANDGKPAGYASVTSMLSVDGAAKALEFYKNAFGAKEKYRLEMGDKVGHAEFSIGDTHFMLGDEYPDMKMLGPKKRGGTSVSFMIYVPDADAAFAKAIAAGATEERPVTDQFWGDRTGTVVDPFGHRWSIGTHVREVPIEEMRRVMAEMAKAGG